MAGNKRFTNVYTYERKSAQSCPAFWDPINCSLPGSSVHGILQARILEWVPPPGDLRGYSRPRDQTHISCISCTAGRFFAAESPGKRHDIYYIWLCMIHNYVKIHF